ncbi:pyruvate kinase [Escherichia coli]
MKKTKIVCTIGPKTESKEMLAKMLDAGMNVMRLTFSHGDYAEHGSPLSNLRAVMAETGKHAAILRDTKGPEIRTMKLEGGNDVALVAGQTFIFTTAACGWQQRQSGGDVCRFRQRSARRQPHPG